MSKVKESGPTETAHRFAKDQLKSIVERVEKLADDKQEIADDIKEVYAEAKGNGFDVKALRSIVRMRRQDRDNPGTREATDVIVETYMLALGMLK